MINWGIFWLFKADTNLDSNNEIVTHQSWSTSNQNLPQEDTSSNNDTIDDLVELVNNTNWILATNTGVSTSENITTTGSEATLTWSEITEETFTNTWANLPVAETNSWTSVTTNTWSIVNTWSNLSSHEKEEFINNLLWNSWTWTLSTWSTIETWSIITWNESWNTVTEGTWDTALATTWNTLDSSSWVITNNTWSTSSNENISWQYVSNETKSAIDNNVDQKFLDNIKSYFKLSNNPDLSEANFGTSESDDNDNLRARIAKAAEEDKKIQDQIDSIEEQKKALADKFNNLDEKKSQLEWNADANILNTEKWKTLTAKMQFIRDTDTDWLSDHIESILWTNSLLLDSDWDWYSDFDEIKQFRNPDWKWLLFAWVSNKLYTTIYSAVQKALVHIQAWEPFDSEKEIDRIELVKILVSAIYPHKIYENSDLSNIIIFDDIKKDEDFLKYFRIAQNNELFDWIIAYSFDSEKWFTRAEFITMLIKWLWAKPDSKIITWADTDKRNWFTPYLSKASNLWIISTPSVARFRPNDKITRYEAIKFALNIIKSKEHNK